MGSQGVAEKLLLAGQSYWSAGGRADAILNTFFDGDITVQTQRGTPDALYKCMIFAAGREEELIPNHRNDRVRKQAESDRDNLAARLKQNWDWIVFHDISRGPAKEEAEERLDMMVRFLRKRKPATPIYIEMTWPHKNHEFERYKDIHRYIAVKHNLQFIPTGVAVERVLKERPDIMLFRKPTDRHPSIRGQYLQSCMVYAAIKGKSPEGLPCVIPGAVDNRTKERVELAPDVAKFLQCIAWETWLAEQQLAQQPDYGSEY